MAPVFLLGPSFLQQNYMGVTAPYFAYCSSTQRRTILATLSETSPENGSSVARGGDMTTTPGSIATALAIALLAAASQAQEVLRHALGIANIEQLNLLLAFSAVENGKCGKGNPEEMVNRA